MRLIKAWVKTDTADSKCEFDVEVEDDATEEDIECEILSEVWNYAEIGWDEDDD